VNGWERAKEAAWHRFGAEHYRWFVGLSVARRVAPAALALAAIVVVGSGLWWVWVHIARHLHMPHVGLPTIHIGWWWWLAAGVGAVSVLVITAYRHYLGVPHIGRRRWPAVTAVLAAVGGVIVWLVWG
jgi:hypothetical protein